jgi:hypothetical protein
MEEKPFPKFAAEPRRWMFAMLDLLLAPGVALTPVERERLRKQRETLATDEKRRPGDGAKANVDRIARRCGLIKKRRHSEALRRHREADVRRARVVAVPEAHAVGAPIPRPPPLRRPVVALGGGWSESWDPAAGL